MEPAVLSVEEDAEAFRSDYRADTRNALRDVADALVADDFGFEQSPEGIVRITEATTRKDRKQFATARRAFLDDAHPCWSDGADRSDLETVLAILLG